jgi:hypothetical protein
MGIFDAAGSQPTHGLFDSTAAAEVRSGAADIPGLDDILNSEGAQRIKPVLQAIIGQESGGNAGIGNSVDGAAGIAQVIPDTFKRFAKPGEKIGNTADNLRVAARYLNYLYDKSAGDPAKMAAGYFSGEGNIGADRAYKVDHKDGNGKHVSSYVADVMGRIGAKPAAAAEEPTVLTPETPEAPAAPAAEAPAGPKWSDVVNKPGFADLTPAERELARAEYFNRYVAPSVPDAERSAAKAMFIEKSKALDPKAPGMLDGVLDTLGGIRHDIRQMAGTLPEQIAAKKTGLGVMATYNGQPAPAAKPAPAAPLESRGPNDLFNGVGGADPVPFVKQHAQELSDMTDPSAEARARRLIRDGMNVEQAKYVGEQAAAKGVPVGEEGPVSKAQADDFDWASYKKFNSDPVWKQPVYRAAVKGYEGYKQGILGMNQAIGDLFGADVSGQAALAAESRGKTSAMGEGGGTIQRTFEGAVSSIAQQLPAMIGGVATGSESLVLGSMFMQTFGQEYSEGRAKGQDQGDALKRAGLYGAFEVIGEKLGLGERIKMLRNMSHGVETNALGKWMAQTLTHELPGEELTTLGQFLTDKSGDFGLNQKATLSDLLDQMSDTALQTVMQGAIMGGAGHVANHALGHNDRTDLTAEGDALNKWATDGLSPSARQKPAANGRIEPTMDSFAAGLSPEHQAVDANARDAFSDLTDPKLLDDEVPASTLLGAEAQDETTTGPQAKVGQKYVRVTHPDGTTSMTPAGDESTVTPPSQLPQVWRNRDAGTEGQDPASMRVPEPTALEDGEAAAPAPEGKKTKLTAFEHPDLSDVDVRGELAHMATEAGWEQVGGKMIRADGTDQSSDVVGRTPWIPKQPWYQMIPERLNEEQTIEAVGKALNGEPMTAKEKRVIGNMLDFAKASLEEQRKWRDQVHEEVGATSSHEYEQIGQHADALEAMDEDIPLDHNDPRLKTGNNLTDEEIDGIFGIKQQSGNVSEKPRSGDAREGTQGTGTPAEANGGAFQLQGETPAEVKAKTEAAEKAEKAKKKAEAEAEAKDKAEREKKDVQQRAPHAIENFQLGEDPEAALSGQKDIFGEEPAAPKERFADRNNASVKEINGQIDRETESWGFKPGHFDNNTFSSGRIAPHFEVRDDIALPTVNNRLGDAIRLGQGPNGKWGFGLDIYGDVYGPGQKGIHEHVLPDGRKQYDTREEAIDAALEKVKEHGKPGAYEALREAAKKSTKPKTEKEAKAKRELKPADDLGAMFDDILAEETGAKPKESAEELARRLNDAEQRRKDDESNKRADEIRANKPKTEQEAKDRKAADRRKVKNIVDAIPDTELRRIGEGYGLVLEHKDHQTNEGIRKSLRGASLPELERVVNLDLDAESTKHLAAIEGAIAKGVQNAAVVPSERGGTKGMGERAKAAFERALTAAGWTFDKKAKEWNKGKAGLFLRSQGDLAGPIVQWTPDAAATKAKVAAMKDAPRPAPKTEKKAKAKDEKPAKTSETDLDSMFDDILAEETGAKPKARHEMTQAENRNAPDRGQSAGLSFAKINLDNETVESLLATHRKEIPALGALMGAKGGKNVAKMAADIMRIWKLRDTLAKATVESIVKENDAAGVKALAKAVGGIYTSANGKETWAKAIIKWRDDQRTKATDRLQDAKHYLGVRAALEVGKTVSDEVVKPYPDLAAEYFPRGSAAYNAGIRALAGEASNRATFAGELPSWAQSYRDSAAKKTGKEAEIDTDIAGALDKMAARTDKAFADAAGQTSAPPQVERTAGEAAASAVKHSAAGFANAIVGLGELFGANGPKMGVVQIDEPTYRRAAPLFDAAIQHFGQAAADIRDVMRAVIRAVAEQFGAETTANMKPYIVRFIQEYQEGKRNEPTTGTDPQQDRADDAHAAPGSDHSVHGGPAAAGATGEQHGDQAGGQQDAGPGNDLGVHDAGTATRGEGRRDGVSEPNGELGVGRSDSESSGPGRGDGTGTDGATAHDPNAGAGVAEAVEARDVVKRQTFTEKVAAQKKAESVPVTLGDKANIDATLPLLQDGQREDVHFAEKRLSQPHGFGVLFANGTGTGKTYLSLGIVKRMLKSGKKNGIVIVPDDAVMKEWLASAPNLGIDLHVLKDKQDMGKGVSITTYANFGDNMTLLDRAHDFVVADEAHNLMRSKDAVITKPLRVVRALTLHPDSAHQRTDMIHRELAGKIADLRAELTALMNKPESTEQELARAEELGDALEPLYKEYRAKLDEQTEILKSIAPQDRPRLVAVSATPFAYESNIQWAEGYVLHYPSVKQTGAYNEPNPYQKFMIQNFGYRMKTGKLNEPDAKVDRALMQIQFNMRLRKEGVLSTRMLDVDADYDRKFALVEAGIGARLDAALKWLREAEGGKYRVFFEEADEQFDYLTKRRLLEAIKAKAAVDIIKQHHALGRKVVVWHDYNQGGGFAPFNFAGNPNDIITSSMRDGGGMSREVKYPRREFLDAFRERFADLMGDELAKLKSPIETLREAFPNALFNNGLEKKKDAQASIAKFNDDSNPDANLIVVQSAKNAGWSGHDKTGKFQRVSINLGLPTAPVASIQQEGRIYRTGQITNAIFRYLNTGTLFERIAFATSIATRAEATENMAMGDFARGLKKSFIDAFLDSGDYPPGADEGTGGKAQDRRREGMTPFAVAKSHYFSQEKKTSRNKAAEGKDYFATPEPLGLKMVEWLGAKPGESLLEPSGGHGAIARWFPDNTRNKVIEQSDELASKLRLNVADPEGVTHGDFEDHHIGNKYDGIAMNPPFGTGGKLAMEHLAKAFVHLREGGRIVAILPDGPAMGKRVQEWLTGTTTSARGVTTLNNPDVRLEHVIELPPSTFGRAGTGVHTSVYIIDRIKDGNDGTGKAHSVLRSQNDVYKGDINDLFNYIEHMTVPGRPTVAAAAAPATKDMTAGEVASELTKPAVVMHDHGRVVSDASQAVFKKVGDKLETDAPVSKVTTAAGKVLEGVFVPDGALAKSIDAFTWKPKGQTEFFVRIKHVIRPQGAVFSKGATVAAENRVSVSALVQMVNNHLKKFAAQIPVEVRESVSELGLRDAAGNPITSAKGLTYDGKIYLFRDGLTGMADARDTLFHEMFHFGVRRFLTRSQYITTMAELYRGDPRIRQMADAWIKSEEGQDLIKEGNSPEYVRARGVDEALAHFADRVNANPTGFVDNSMTAKVMRTYMRVLARIAEFFGNKQMAEAYRGVTNDAARAIIKDTFGRLRSGEAANPAGMQGNGMAFRTGAVNLNPAVTPKVGLLDTPMRLAFQKTGALAVWRGAFRLLETTASKALDNKVGEIIKAGLIDRYGLSDAVIERHEEMRVKMIEGVRTADRFLDRLKGLSRSEYAVLYAAANNANIAAVNDMIKELPEDSQKALHEIKALVRDLGQEAVDLKMLDADTFKANELAYLHRSYLKHEAALTEGEKANRATRIKGDQFKARGLADIVSSDRLMKWMPEFWGTRVKNGAVTNGSIGQQFIRFERRDDPTPTANIEGVDGVPALGRLKEVVYWPVGEETPAKFADWHNEGEWTIRRTVGSNVVFRRDFTDAERKRMGEIEDIRYAMAKTINIATHDVEVGKYFNWLAEGHARVPGDLPAGAKVIDDARKAESKVQAFGKDVWVKVPETKIQGTGVSAYGKLAGRYIPGPIWTDIRAVASGGAFFSSNIGKGYEKLLSLWKISKTALSPAVHVNNVMANVVMADWHDVSGTHLLKAAVAWARQGKSEEHKRLVQDFQDHGGELGTYALSEMQRNQLGPILEELLGQARADNDLNGTVNAAGVLSLLREGMVRQAAATLGQSKVGRVAGAIPSKMIDVYQLEDQIFRLAAFIKARESGLTDREAGRFARKSFLDYDIQAPWVVAAKRSGLLPFISFSYRAVPMLYQTLRDKPWKLMKLALVLGAMSAASAAFLGLGGDDQDDERRWLPDEKRGNIWGMIPKMVRMPWNTKSGNPVFLDVRRFIPAGDITDLGSSHGAVPLPPFLSIGGPLAILAELWTNKSQFTGQPITLESDTNTEAALKVLDYAYKWAAPNVPLPSLGTITPGTEPGQFQSYSWTGIVNASRRQEGTFGRDQNLPEAVGSAFGVKLEGYNPQVGEKNAKAAMNAKLQELAKQKSSARKQSMQGGLSDAEFGRKIEHIQKKEQDLKQEFFDRHSK